MTTRLRCVVLIALLAALGLAVQPVSARTNKPPLHALHWLAITGKPLAATAGAMMFQKGGNAVDATAAMLAAACTMWDTLSWAARPRSCSGTPRHTR